MWKSIFGTRPEKTPSKPNTIHVPPKEEEQPKQENKEQENEELPENPGLSVLDSNQFFNNLKSDPVNPNEYNPPSFFAGMSLSTSTTQRTTSVFASGPTPPTQTPNIPMQLNPKSSEIQNSIFGINPQNTQNSMFASNSTSIFGVPLTMQNQNSDRKSIFPENQSKTNLNKTNEEINLSKDGSIFSLEGMKITQPDSVNRSFTNLETNVNLSGLDSKDYNPPKLFEFLSTSQQVEAPKKNLPEVEEKPSQVAPPTNGKFWDSYKRTTSQPENAKAGSKTASNTKADEKLAQSKLVPHTPENRVKQNKDKMFGKNDADITCSPIQNVSKHSIYDEDKDISLSKDKNNDESDEDVIIDQKHPIRVDSDDDKKPSKPYRVKLSSDSSLEEAKAYISNRISQYQREVECIVENQIQKLKLIKDKRSQEDKLTSSIKEKESKLAEASKAEEYDLADRLQNEITRDLGKIENIQKQMDSLHKQKAELELKVKEVEEAFIKSIKEDISVLIEIESRHSTEKNIYKKTEENKIEDIKSSLKSREIRINETEKEIDKKITEGDLKIKKLQNECDINAKEPLAEKNKLDEQIQIVSDEIAELERQLKEKLAQMDSLEEARDKLAKDIRKINQEFEADIEDLSEMKEKYERKRQVNEEQRFDLENEKQQLLNQENQLAQSIEEYESKIRDFVELTTDMSKKAKNKEKLMNKQYHVVQEYEQKQKEYSDLTYTISNLSKELKSSENEINAFDDELDDSCSKLNELDKNIEELEEEKKVLAQKKKFKDAKRVKETLEFKIEKRDAIQIKINEVKQLKELAEEKRSFDLKSLQKINKKKIEEELKLREYEYQILVLKLNYVNEIEKDKRDSKLESDDKEQKIDAFSNQHPEIIKYLTKEIQEYEEKYGFSLSFDSENESKQSIEVKSANKVIINDESESSKDLEEQEVEVEIEKQEDEEQDKSESEENTCEDFSHIPVSELKRELTDAKALILQFEDKINQASENEDYDEADRLSSLQGQIQDKVAAIMKHLESRITEEEVEEEKIIEEKAKVEESNEPQVDIDSQEHKDETYEIKDQNDDIVVENEIIKNLTEAEETSVKMQLEEDNNSEKHFSKSEVEKNEENIETAEIEQEDKENQDLEESSKEVCEPDVNILTSNQPKLFAPMSLDMFEMGFGSIKTTSEEPPHREDESFNKNEEMEEANEESQTNESEYVPPFIPM